MREFLGLPLFVPRKTFPPATTGFPFEVDPSRAFHLMFVPFLASQDSGRPFMADAMLRSAVPPHSGQSWASTGKPGSAAQARAARWRVSGPWTRSSALLV